MRLDHASTIAGFPVKKVRAFLRQMGRSEWVKQAIADHFKVEGSDLGCQTASNIDPRSGVGPSERTLIRLLI